MLAELVVWQSSAMSDEGFGGVLTYSASGLQLIKRVGHCDLGYGSSRIVGRSACIDSYSQHQLDRRYSGEAKLRVGMCCLVKKWMI